MAKKEDLLKRLSLFWSKKYKLVSLIGLIVVLVVVTVVALRFRIFASTTGGNCKWLISYGVSHNGAVPEYIGWYNGKSNLQHIESLPEFPYDGVGIETWQYSPTNVMHLVMEPNKLGYQTIYDEYKPFIDLAAHGLKPTKLKHNFIMVHLEQAGAFYDPNNATDKASSDAKWANVADNFANLTRVAKAINESGFPIDGIFLDNEGPYGASDGLWHCGGTFAPACSSSNLTSYQEQSRQRGKQIMEAIKPYSYPGFHFMFMHSTDTSCTLDPNNRNNPPGLGTNWVEWANQLLGPFTIGLAESAKNSDVRVVDGGEESYGYLTQDYFTVSKDYRNSGMATQMDGSKLACNFIPPEDRTTVQTWSDLFDTAFAMYNRDPSSTPGQTVDTIQQSMKLALQNSDNYVWFYIEGGITTIDSPYGTQIGQDWTHNIKLARDAVPNDPNCGTAPTSSPTSTVSLPSSPSLSPSPSNQPDLTITNVNFSPATPHVGDEVSFSVDIKNVGTAATPTGAGIFLGAGFKIDGAWVTWNDTNTASLAPGATITLTPSRQDGGKTTWTATQGSHTLTTIVDNINKIAESNEANNENTKTINVEGPGGVIPAAPTNLAASAVSSSRIDLTWADTSLNEDGFVIERSTSSSSGFIQIGSVGANVIGFSNTGLQSNKTYYYRVKAFNIAGSSAYSNTASAKTKKRWWIF